MYGARVGFELSKWYLDCVTDEGEVRIGYAAELATGALRLRYASVLSAASARAVRTDTRLRSATLPEQHGELIDWRAPALTLTGRWTRAVPALPPLELLEVPGALRWSCLQPRATVALDHEGMSLRGTGYAERVELRVPPWELPLDELRWGRAHVGPRTLVWLDWRGPRDLRRVFLDGLEVDGEVRDEEVRAAGLRVKLAPLLTLRDGEVAKTAFGRVPALRRLAARHKLSLRESKWLSRASAGEHEGFAVHEVVRWQ